MLLLKAKIRADLRQRAIVKQCHDLLLPKHYLDDALPLLLIELHLTATRTLDLMTRNVRRRINVAHRSQVELCTLLFVLILLRRLLHLLLLVSEYFLDGLFEVVFKLSFGGEFALELHEVELVLAPYILNVVS